MEGGFNERPILLNRRRPFQSGVASSNDRLKDFQQWGIMEVVRRQDMEISTTRKILTRDFVLGFLGRFIFQSAHHILIPTLPIYLSKLGSEETEIGVLIGVFGISSLFFRPFIGKALLRHSEKGVMMVGTFLFALAALAYFLAKSFWPLLIVRLVQGVGFAFFTTASFTFIASISQRAHLGQSLSYFYLAPNLSLALAPTLGIFLVNHFSFNLLFSACVCLSLGSLFMTHKLGGTKVIPLEDSSREKSSFFSREVLPPSIISSFTHVVWGALTAFFPLYAINCGVANPGLFFTAIAVMLILGRAFGGRILDVYSRERVMLYFLASPIISMALLVFSKTQSMFVLVAAIWGFGHAFLMPSLMAYALDRAGSSRRGPAIGTYTAISDVGLVLGPMIMGVVIRLTNYPIMFSCLALISAVSFGYFYFSMREKK